MGIKQAYYRTVVNQATRVRMVYRHTLTLECGHIEYRVGVPWKVAHKVKCTSCIIASTEEEKN